MGVVCYSMKPSAVNPSNTLIKYEELFIKYGGLLLLFEILLYIFKFVATKVILYNQVLSQILKHVYDLIEFLIDIKNVT